LEVHRNLGPGLLRSAYEEALCYELSKSHISFERNKLLSITFGHVRFDDAVDIELIVGREVMVVCLSVDEVNQIEKARLLARLRQGGWPIGLIVNFNVKLLRDGIQRVVNSRRSDLGKYR
jgi:GxxExxY protein